MSRPWRILVLMGTRPEVIKLAPLVLHLSRRPEFETLSVLTGQHREMVEPIIRLFDLPVTRDLAVMTPDQSLEGLTAALFTALGMTLADLRPDCVVVQGDTTSTMVGAVCAFYRKIPVGHVEAGLRTATVHYPFPEEMNRRLVSQVAAIHFAPTARAQTNLQREGIAPDRIRVTGNTGIDALRLLVERTDLELEPSLQKLVASCSGPLILITAHRRENLPYMAGIARAIQAMLQKYPRAHVVFPVHFNPRVRAEFLPILSGQDRCHLLDPLPYDQFVLLMKACTLILTDSGGIQEEAPSLGKPVLVMRRETERPEASEAGTVRLVGEDPNSILSGVAEVLTAPRASADAPTWANPFGDGHASEKITETLLGLLPKLTEPRS